MGFILTLIIIWLFIQYLTWRENPDDLHCSMTVSGVIGVLIIATTILLSYANYVCMVKNKAAVQQYADSINIYYTKGVHDMAKDSVSGGDVTDFKYGQYQESMSLLLREFRSRVAGYNRDLAGKKVMNDSWYWNWVVIVPDDNTPLSMAQYLKE